MAGQEEKNVEQQQQQQNTQQQNVSNKKKKRSLLSRLLGAGNKEASTLAGGAKQGFALFREGLSTNLMGGVGKIATMLGLSNTAVIAILSSILGGGILAIFGLSDVKRHDAAMRSDDSWTCVSDEIDFSNALSGAEDIQENVNIMYDVFVNHYGYSEEFLIGMVACFMTESYVTAEVIEHGAGSEAENAFFVAAGSAAGNVDSNAALDAYHDYGALFPNANSGYSCSHGQIGVGVGIVQWTGGRGDALLEGQDLVDGYHWYDLPYQLAFMLAEFEKSYPTLAPTSSEWMGRDAYDSTVFFFTTYVSGGNDDPALVSNRTDNIPEATSYVTAASINSQYTGDVNTMANILAEMELEANIQRIQEATICDNDSRMETGSIVEAALSVSWLEGADYANDDAAQQGIRRSATAPFMMNNWNYSDGFDRNHNHVDGDSVKHDMIACTEYYYLAHLITLPKETGVNGNAGYFSSCDRSAAVPIRMSGRDDAFPAGGPVNQLVYMLTGASHNAGEVDQDDSFNETYDISDLAAAEGTRNGNGNPSWNPVGFLRGGSLYSYTGAASISPGTVMVSMGNQDSPNGNLPSRFVDMYNPTTRHIMIYAGYNAVQNYWGDYLIQQKTNFASTSDAALSQSSSIYNEHADSVPVFNWIKESYASAYNNGAKENAFFLDYGDFNTKIKDIMSAGNSYKRKFAPKGNDQKQSFLTAGEEKNGLNTFKSFEEIRHDITNAHPEWTADQIKLFSEMVYRAQQHNRWMYAGQFSNLPTEEDGAIGIYFYDGQDQNAYVNGYQYMPAHMDGSGNALGPKESLINENSKYWIEDAPLAHQFFLFNTVVSNDMLQDLIQSWSKKEGHDDVYRDLGYQWGLTPADFNEIYETEMGNADFEKIMQEYSDLVTPLAIEQVNLDNESDFRMFTYDPDLNFEPDSTVIYKDVNDRTKTWMDAHYDTINGQYFPKIYIIVNADKSHMSAYQGSTNGASELRADYTGSKNLYGDGWLDAAYAGKEPFLNTANIYSDGFKIETHTNLANFVGLPGHQAGAYETIDLSDTPDTVLSVTFNIKWVHTGNEIDNPDYEEPTEEELLDPDFEPEPEKIIEVESELEFEINDGFWAHGGYDHKNSDYYRWRYLDADGNELTLEQIKDLLKAAYPDDTYGPSSDPTTDGGRTEGNLLENVFGTTGVLVYVQIDDKDFGTWSDFDKNDTLGYQMPEKDYIVQLKPGTIRYQGDLYSEKTWIEWPNQWTAAPGEDWEAGFEDGDEYPSYGMPRPDKSMPYIIEDGSGNGNAYSFVIIDADGKLLYEHLDSEAPTEGSMTHSVLQRYTKDTHHLMNELADYRTRISVVTAEDLFGISLIEDPVLKYTGTDDDWNYINGIRSASDPDAGGDPGGVYSLLSYVAGFDHVIHTNMGGTDNPRGGRDDDIHYDMYGNEITDTIGDFGHWVVHGSRGTRGPKTAYLDFYSFFEQEGNKFSYMLFMSTPEEGAVEESKYRKIIEYYNYDQRHSR